MFFCTVFYKNVFNILANDNLTTDSDLSDISVIDQHPSGSSNLEITY